MIYESDRTEPLEFEAPIDRRAARFYGFIYRPSTWQATTEYTSGNYVIPTVPNGKYYSVKVCGVSDDVEPTDWSVVDGTVEWEETCYKLLPTGVTITNSEWEADDADVLLTQEYYDDGSTRVLVDVSGVADDVTQITLSNITTRSNLEVEVRSVIIPIAVT